MKYFLQIVLLLLPLASSAQNALFLPFGQLQTQVDSFIQTRDYFKEIEQVDPDLVSCTIINSNSEVNYYFKNNRLYSVEDIRYYFDKEDAQLALDACLEYLHEKGEVYKAFNSKDVQHYVSVDDHKMTEVFIYFNTRTFAAEVHLKSTSRKYGPRLKTETFIAELTNTE